MSISRSSSTFTSFREAATIRQKVDIVLSSRVFEFLMSAIILLNVMLMVVETDASAECVSEERDSSECSRTWIVNMNYIFLSVYTLESLLRLFTDRCKFFKTAWNNLDAFIVVCGWGDIVLLNTVGSIPGPNTSLLRIFRVTRLARVLRIAALFPELDALIRGFIGAMMSMLWGFIMILVFVIIFALLSVELLNPINVKLTQQDEYCNEVFSSVWNAGLMYIQTLVAGDSWGLCAIPIIQDNKPASLLFISALICLQLGVTNLILAVIVERANMAHEQDMEKKLNAKAKEIEKAADKLKGCFSAIDEDSSGNISCLELEQGFDENPALRRELQCLDIDRPDLGVFFKLLDAEGTGELDYDDLVDALLSASMGDGRKQMMMLRLQATEIARSITELREAFNVRRATVKRSPSAYPADAPHVQKSGSVNSLDGVLMHSSATAVVPQENVRNSVGATFSRRPSATAGETQEKVRNTVGATFSKVQHSNGTDLTVLHQTLKQKLNDLEQDVLETIDSWATSQTGIQRSTNDSNVSREPYSASIPFKVSDYVKLGSLLGKSAQVIAVDPHGTLTVRLMESGIVQQHPVRFCVKVQSATI